MKKVLIIAYHFPPDSAVGAIRPAKFAKYLPEFGWEPVVYTVKEKYYGSCDYSRFESVLKSLKIYRANLIPGPLTLYSRLIHNSNNSSNESLRITQAANRTSKRKSTLKRLLGPIARIPDDQQGWILNILISGYRIIKKHKIDAFITSGPPMGTHVGGLLLKYLTHAKWIADFRDPWYPGLKWDELQYRTPISDEMHKRLECQVIRKADLLISTAPSVTTYFKSKLPERARDKCLTITNGFDESDFIGITPRTAKQSKVRIVYAGSLYVGRNPEPFFAALEKLVLSNAIDKNQFEIEFIGEVEYYNNKSVPALIKEYRLESFVKLSDRIPFKACLERLLSSNALLLFAQDFPEQIPAKIFEYLRMNKLIFAIANEGDTKRLLESFPNVFIANPHKVEDVSYIFLQMLSAINNGEKYLGWQNRISQFDHRNVTERLARCLDNIG